MLRNIFMKNNRKILYSAFGNNVAFCPISKRSLNRSINNSKLFRLDENSLQIRILKYFDDDYTKYTELIDRKIVDPIKTSDYRQENLKNVNDNQMAYLISYLPKLYLKSKDYAVCMNNLDKESCTRLPRLATNEIFQYLHSFMTAMPQNITFLSFYTKAVQKMTDFIENLSKMELVQICFYVGLKKKTKESQMILKDCLKRFNKKYVDTMNQNDLAVLCNSSYKTSLKVEEQTGIIHKVVVTLNNHLAILSDATIFVTFVKSLRQNQYRSEELLATIGHTIFFNNTIAHYNLTACTHILALYAETLYFDEKLFDLLINTFASHLRQTNHITSRTEHFTKQVRIKDVARFLWSLSQIGYAQIDQTIITSDILPVLNAYIGIGELDSNIEHFVDSALSMWILGCQPPEKYLTSIVNKKTISLIHAKRKRRFTARLNLLLTCIQWEAPELFATLRLPAIPSESPTIIHNLRNRPYLKATFSALCKIAPKCNVPKIELTTPIPYLNIVGITGYDTANNIIIYIEIIDEILKLKNDQRKPNGLMKLKERLLKLQQKPILMIFKEDLEDVPQLQIERYLERKLKRFLPSSS